MIERGARQLRVSGFVVSRAVFAARRMRCSSSDAARRPPPYELGGDPNFDPTLHTLFNIQELVGGDVTELPSRGAEVQVTLLWAALLGTKLQKPT